MHFRLVLTFELTPTLSWKERVCDAQFCSAVNIRSGAHDYGSALSVTFERPRGKNNQLERFA